MTDECGYLLDDLDSMTRQCGDVYRYRHQYSNGQYTFRVCRLILDLPEYCTTIISQIMIDVEPYLGTYILTDGTLFIAFVSESTVEIPVYYIKISYQNGNGQTNFEKNLTDIHIFNDKCFLVSISFLPDNSTDHIQLPSVPCGKNNRVTCLNTLNRVFYYDCNLRINCVEKYAYWKQNSNQKRNLKCGVTSINSLLDSLYEPCLTDNLLQAYIFSHEKKPLMNNFG
ncbi:uncharacterized protein LOC117119093 [Anneissia japonica]|uniref:uncharacterized protein LOC117119093 n=1 Tax=Anneissia japonica TaxID=1529436 RepID=UPI0014256EC3|nr:uncharacterized protein LOC117119093 [Anneissia japonica]